MFEAKVIEHFSITGRGRGVVIESIPEDITDLRDLQGMHILINEEEYEITGVEMFRDVNGMYRTKGPQSILIKKVDDE